MRVLVCGDRNWKDEAVIALQLVQTQPRPTLIIHGAARGADTMAGEVAGWMGVPVLVFHADWDKHGKAAGLICNQQMLDEGKPDLVLAFHNDLDASKGTKDMVRRARKAGIPVFVYKGKE